MEDLDLPRETRGAGRAAGAAPQPIASASRSLVEEAAPLWERITAHPFVRAVGDGSLDPAVFDRWIVADYVYVIGCRRLIAGLVAAAPDEGQRDTLAAGLSSLGGELDIFRTQATRRGIDLELEPGPTTLGYTAYTQAVLYEGYPVALTALYGIEKAYFDAWASVRETAAEAYWPFVDNWSSASFGRWVGELADLVDRAFPDGATPAASRAFHRIARFEVHFWDAVHDGDTW